MRSSGPEVLKSGGVAVGSAEAIRIAAGHVRRAAPRVAVVGSAMNGVTDLLHTGYDAGDTWRCYAGAPAHRSEPFAARGREPSVADQVGCPFFKPVKYIVPPPVQNVLVVIVHDRGVAADRVAEEEDHLPLILERIAEAVAGDIESRDRLARRRLARLRCGEHG